MNSKHPLASKTIWGALITLIVGVVGIFGLDLSNIDVEKLATSAAVVAGSALAVYGRFKADKPIGKDKDDA
jgi:hypothetical protein